MFLRGYMFPFLLCGRRPVCTPGLLSVLRQLEDALIVHALRVLHVGAYSGPRDSA